MADEIPKWALERVCELANADGSHYDLRVLDAKTAGAYSIGQAFARYIAEHEEPPVDPLAEVLSRWNFQPHDMKHVHEELAKRGLKIVPVDA